MFLSDTDKATISAKSPTEILGNIIQNQIGVIVGTYDFARDGGAVGSISLKDINTGLPISLPIGTIISKSWIDVQTPCTTSASATVALSTGETAADVLAATAAASVTGIMAGVSVGTAATMKKTTAARTPVAVIAVGAVTAGKFSVFLEYVRSS